MTRQRNRARGPIRAAALAALLAACGQQVEESGPGAQAETGPILINVTAAAEPTPGGVLALAAMPRTEDFWRGALFAASGDGGIVAYDADGAVIAAQEGPRYHTLAAAPDFQLRGADLPLLAALDIAAGEIAVYAFSRDQGALFLAPTQPIAAAIVPRGVCAASSGAGTFEFLVLGEAGGAERWRLRDTGETRLSAERLAALPFDAPARFCAVNGETGDLYTGTPGIGVTRMSEDGEVLAESGIAATNMTFGVFGGHRRLVVTQGDGEVLMLDPETLEVTEHTKITQGFSTPGVEAPGALAYTASTYGGAYPDGFLAVGDDDDGRPKFIDRGYIGRRLAEPENRFAPGPASAS